MLGSSLIGEVFKVDHVPNINKFGGGKWPNIMNFKAQRRGSNLANSPNIVHVSGFCYLPIQSSQKKAIYVYSCCWLKESDVHNLVV